jgi:hypothetical protein
VHRLSLIVSVIMFLALLLPMAAATAQEATPASSPSAGQPLDLAAMALVPTDFNIPGLGRNYAAMYTLDQEVTELAEYYGTDPAVVREALVAAGWQRKHRSRLQAPEVYGAADPVLAQQVASYVYEYADAEGAAAGFAFIEDESSLPSAGGGATPVVGGEEMAEDIPGTRVIGDESEITRHVGVGAPSGLPFRALDLTFRLDNLVAGVTVRDYLGGEPDVAEVEALAQTYLERIEQVRAEGGPGLSNRIVRLEAPDIEPGRDDYTRLSGVDVPDHNESAEALAAKSARAGTSSDIYYVFQRLPAGSEETGDDVAYQAYITRFADEAAASDWLNKGEERLSQIGAFVGVEPMPDATPIGDESRTYAIDRLSGEQETRGYLIQARVGSDIAEIRLFAQPEAPLAVAEVLAQVQVTCLESAEVCALVPVPAKLVALAVLATPVAATPVS